MGKEGKEGKKREKMKDRHSHRERIEMIMKGEKPDRFAASIWRHFFHKESSTDGLVEVMLDFQKRLDWDFMKINPRATFHIEDWGTKMEWSNNEFENHKYIEHVVKDISDWDKIDILPMNAPVLSEHLRAISMIKKASDPGLPLFMTIFCPLGVARYMTGSTEKMLRDLADDPERVNAALENICTTFEKYVQECLNAGADGIFYATLEWASADTLSYDQYEKYGRPYDLRILKATGGALNILHVCGSNNYLKELSDYPVGLVNWDASDPTNPNLDDSFDFLGNKIAVGGLDNRGWLWHSRPDEVAHEISRLKERMAGKRFIFGSGCTIAAEIPYENLDAVRKSL